MTSTNSGSARQRRNNHPGNSKRNTTAPDNYLELQGLQYSSGKKRAGRETHRKRTGNAQETHRKHTGNTQETKSNKENKENNNISPYSPPYGAGGDAAAKLWRNVLKINYQ